MKSKKILIGATLIIAIIIAGCATFKGPMELSGVPPAVTWISPVNQDGVKDSLEVNLEFPAYKNLVVSSYSFIVADESGKNVFTIGKEAGKSKNSNLTVPSTYNWDGKDSNGKYAPDGEYFYFLKVVYGPDKKYESPTFTVIVDNTAPNLELSAAYPLFSPDGDGRLDSVRIFQRYSSVEEEWNGTIVDGKGEVINSFKWSGVASDFDWDGSNSSGKTVADGAYAYKIGSTDEAGNKALFTLDGITVNTSKASVSISRDLEVFSPNSDGKKDVVTFKISALDRAAINKWTVSIHDRTGESVRTYSGEGNLPDSIIFDGKDNKGAVLSDGLYKGHILITSKNGGTSEDVSQLFELDTTPPLVNLSAEYLLFSPDGDGNRDNIMINQSTSQEGLWTAAIIDSKGSRVKTYSWSGRAVQFSWNGLDAAGRKSADGTYTYRIESTDKADNYTIQDLPGIRIDTRVPVVSLTALQDGASPDSDGFDDYISFALTTDMPAEIKTWNIKIQDEKGQLVKTFTPEEMSTDLPERIDWNGEDENGKVIESEFTAALNVEYLKGNSVGSKTNKSFLIDVTGPKTTLSVSPVPFSPDQDGIDEILSIKTSAKDVSGIDAWEIRILDPVGNLFRKYSGRGELTDVIRWDGTNGMGEVAQAASDYTIIYTVKDRIGNSSTVKAVAPVDVLVIKDGANLKIIISSIYFVPNKADYLSLDADKVAKNLATLDRLAEILKKYSQYKIRLEGHAVRVYWDNPAKLAAEQNDVLMPLSTERAEVIKDALVSRGIKAERLTTVGYGGNRPIVPHSDLVNRWKNRRVEFILIKQ